ncbi:hypothetical protein [Ureibacillus sp. GCM10028918]|uniref:hypothetical protein n=1 Tax=Ureibacillus sp. GCM10028918 TaxID=3273429 RepID=UPI0036218F0B
MKQKTTIILLISFTLFLIFSLYAKDYLVVNEDPLKSDVIVALSGYSGRLENGTTKEEAIEFGNSKELHIIEEQATSTYTNAVMQKKKW